MGNNESRFRNSDGTQQLSEMLRIHPLRYSSSNKEWTETEFHNIHSTKIEAQHSSKPNDEQKQNPNDDSASSFIVMSFNIWFGDENFEQRQRELVKILQEIEPHIFCFQEVTAKWLKLFEQIPFIQNNYCITATSNHLNTIQRYGNFIGARIDKLHILNVYNCKLESVMGRRLLSMQVLLKDKGEVMWINTVHLESKNTSKTRIKQLDIIFNEYIARRMKQNECMLMGDFNFRDNDNAQNTLAVIGQECKENEHLNEEQFMDCWKAFAKQKNVNIADGWTRRIGYRYDRILMKTNRWKIADFKIVGDAEKRMPSDHKGVVVFLE